jgi:hypothetical protein
MPSLSEIIHTINIIKDNLTKDPPLAKLSFFEKDGKNFVRDENGTVFEYGLSKVTNPDNSDQKLGYILHYFDGENDYPELIFLEEQFLTVLLFSQLGLDREFWVPLAYYVLLGPREILDQTTLDKFHLLQPMTNSDVLYLRGFRRGNTPPFNQKLFSK